MPDEPDLIDTLHDTSALLAAARKSIAANGHRQALLPIDRLIAMVERDVDRRLSALLSRRFRTASLLTLPQAVEGLSSGRH